MKTIRELIVGIPVKKISGDVDQEIKSIHFDSRKVEPGSLFVAVKGKVTDGHKFIDKAVDRGALCIVREEQEMKRVEAQDGSETLVEIIVEDSASALAHLASAFYGHPSEMLIMVGVTGTNGKTTVATLLYDLFTQLGYTCGLISTIENRIGGVIEPTGFTTPDAVTIQEALSRMVAAGCTHAFMEVSSHALDQKRVEVLA